MSREAVTGIGIGFRQALSSALFSAEAPEVRWVEIHPENYIDRGGRFEAMLERAQARWPIVTHGLTMGFGSVEPAEASYTRSVKELLRRVGTPWHSDHLCMPGTDGVMLHDLLPLPFTREAVRTAVARIREARDALEVPIAIENISYYAHPGSERAMDEADFILEVLESADAQLLLDINNVWVNAQNHGFDARAFLDRMPKERVVQIHVAGPTTRPDGLIIDTHGAAVREDVYDLLQHVLRRIGPRPVLLERDQNFPPLDELLAEVRRLDAIYHRATGA